LARVNIDSMSCDPARLICRDDGLVDQELSSGSRTIVGKWGCLLFVIGFHFYEALDCVGLLVIIDDRVMGAAQQDQIILAVPLGWGLVWVVARAPGECRSYLTVNTTP
jgi:hypothetical protein